MALALTVTLAAALAVQLGLWAWIQTGFRRARAEAPDRDDAPSANNTPAAIPISVVVAAHDEAERLPALLDALAAQTHRAAGGAPLFEVVVVDDRSADGTAAVVEARAADFPAPLRVVRIAPGEASETVLLLDDPLIPRGEEPMAPKKNALTRGIAAARHERLAFTDADTAPPPEWLATLAHWATDGAAPDGMTSHIVPLAKGDSPLAQASQGGGSAEHSAANAPPASRWRSNLSPWAQGDDASCLAPADGEVADRGAVLVGYGPLAPAPGWLNRFARYETTLTALLSAAACGWGQPWHAVGRNLSYTKATFWSADGFRPFASSLSGDDDLFVQGVAQRGLAPVRAVLDPGAFVPSAAPPTARAFWRQKRRHSSGGAFYPPGVLRALGAFQASAVVLWVGAPLLQVAFGVPWGWGFLATRILVQRAVLAEAWDVLGADADLALWHPLLDAMYSAYQVAASVLGLLPMPKTW